MQLQATLISKMVVCLGRSVFGGLFQAGFVLKTGSSPQESISWDSPGSDLLSSREQGVPPHSRGNLKRLGKQND